MRIVSTNMIDWQGPNVYVDIEDVSAPGDGFGVGHGHRSYG